jgi:hypothetical protein
VLLLRARPWSSLILLFGLFVEYVSTLSYAEFVLIWRGAALLVHRPGIGFVATADDAVVAGDVELPRVRRDDRETVDLALVRVEKPTMSP